MENEYRSLPIGSIKFKTQVRRTKPDAESSEGLNSSVEKYGILQPPTVYYENAVPYLYIGEQRLLKAIASGQESITVRVVPAPRDEAERIAVQLQENLHRSDLTVYDKAVAFAELLKARGCKVTELAEILGLSKATVVKHLRILTLPEDIREKVRTGEIGLSAAYELSIAGGSEQQRALAVQVAEGTITRDELTHQVKQLKPANPKQPRLSIRNNVELSNSCGIYVDDPQLSVSSLIHVLEQFVAKLRGVPEGTELQSLLKAIRSEAAAVEGGGP
jgi:ParB/RepB/Spo0J family partition protein